MSLQQNKLMLCFYIDPPARFGGITEPGKRVLQMDLVSSLDFSKELYAIGYQFDEEGHTPHILVPSGGNDGSWWWSNGLDNSEKIEDAIKVFSSTGEACQFMNENSISVSDVSNFIIFKLQLNDSDVVLIKDDEFIIEKN